MSSKTKRLVLWGSVAFVLVVVITLSTVLPIVLGNRGDQVLPIRLSSNTRTLVMDDMLATHALPTVSGGVGPLSVEWSIHSMEIFPDDGGTTITQDVHLAALVEPYRSSFRLAPAIPFHENGRVIFRARVTQANGVTSNHNFTLNLQDQKENYFTSLFSPNQTLNPAYEAVGGLDHERVFGLWDWDREDNEYVTSGDVMRLAWRYRGEVSESDLEVLILDENDNILPNLPSSGITATLTTTTITIGSQTISRPDRILVNFYEPVIRTIIVRDINNDGSNPLVPRATYNFTYDIRNAVNAHTFDDVKQVEFNARRNYIRYGVYCETLGNLIDPLYCRTDGTHLGGLGESDFIIQNAPANALNWQRFVTMPCPIRVPRTNQTSNVSLTGDANIFAEFERWAPAFRYRDIVLRNNMQTWAEATWFFGNVFGNGFTLDASTYSQTHVDHFFNRRYRNVHGSGIYGWGLEGARFTGGHGWGDTYSFYQLSNHSVIDNIHLIGEEPRYYSGIGLRRTDFRRKSVLGASNLGGDQHEFQVGRRQNRENRPAHWDCTNRGNPVQSFDGWTGFYNAGHTVRNSIIERGLILVGVNYFPNAKYPFTIEHSVLRYAGFTAILGHGHYDIVSQSQQTANPLWSASGGSSVRANNHLGQVDTILETNDAFAVGQPRRFGTFITVRNIVVYEVATAPIMMEEGIAGVYLRVEGDYNKFFTWLRTIDLAFPSFRGPGCWSDWSTILMGTTLNNVARPVIERVTINGPTAGRYRDGNTFQVKLLVLCIAGNSYWEIFNNIWCLDSDFFSASEPVVPIDGMDIYSVHFTYFRVPTQGNGIRPQDQREAFSGNNMARIIRELTPATGAV